MIERECPDGCGACCDPVVLPYGPADLRKLAILSPEDLGDAVADITFAIEHFTILNRKEGLRRAPYLNEGKTVFSFDQFSRPEVAWSYFYSCDRFDPETRRCTAYEDRPPICREYPWYEGDLNDQWNTAKALPKTCVYRADIGQPVEPVTVRLIPKPG